MPSAAILLLGLACLAASGTAAEAPAPPRGALPAPSPFPRDLRAKRVDDHLEAEDGSCHLMAETMNLMPGDTIVGQGILFALQSGALDDAGPTVRAGRGPARVSRRRSAR
jgi:hypothetical protein